MYPYYINVFCFSCVLLFCVFLFVHLHFQTFLEAINNIIKVKHCAFSWNSVAYVVLEQVKVDVLACTL